MPMSDRPEIPTPSTLHYAALAVDRVPSMMAFWDHQERCRFANRAYETWFGADPRALIGRTLRELLGPELYALNKPHIDRALAGEEQEFERIVPGPDGVRRHSLAHYLPQRENGVVTGFFVLVTDVARLKEMEAALRHEQTLRVALEHHARELDQLLRERSEMLEMMAHEVRQPLHNAAAVLENMGGVPGGGGRPAPALLRAQSVLSQVLASLDNTLAAAALVERPDRIRHLDTDIDMLVAIAVGDLPAHQRQRVRVVRETRTRTAAMDISLMRLALRNLLVNALRHSADDAPVTVRISDSDEPLALLIDVADRGRGIEPDLLPRLFQRGARGRQPAGAPSGHGLGLYIVRRVMELHRGSVELLRNAADGATLRLTISQ